MNWGKCHFYYEILEETIKMCASQMTLMNCQYYFDLWSMHFHVQRGPCQTCLLIWPTLHALWHVTNFDAWPTLQNLGKKVVVFCDFHTLQEVPSSQFWERGYSSGALGRCVAASMPVSVITPFPVIVLELWGGCIAASMPVSVSTPFPPITDHLVSLSFKRSWLFSFHP